MKVLPCGYEVCSVGIYIDRKPTAVGIADVADGHNGGLEIYSLVYITT